MSRRCARSPATPTDLRSRRSSSAGRRRPRSPGRRGSVAAGHRERQGGGIVPLSATGLVLVREGQERDEREPRERQVGRWDERAHDRHRRDRRRADHCAGTDPDVARTGVDRSGHGLVESRRSHAAEQVERVAATDDDQLGVRDGGGDVGIGIVEVEVGHLQIEPLELAPDVADVGGVVERVRRRRDVQHPPRRSRESRQRDEAARREQQVPSGHAGMIADNRSRGGRAPGCRVRPRSRRLDRGRRGRDLAAVPPHRRRPPRVRRVELVATWSRRRSKRGPTSTTSGSR